MTVDTPPLRAVKGLLSYSKLPHILSCCYCWDNTFFLLTLGTPTLWIKILTSVEKMSIFLCLDFWNLNIHRECNLFILILLLLVLNIIMIKISSWIWVSYFICVLPSHLKKFMGYKLKVAMTVLLFWYCSSISWADFIGMFQNFSFLSSA